MKPITNKFLEQISNKSYILSTRYRFARTPVWSKKYAEGQLAGLEYIGKLCFYYIQEEKSVKERFREQLLNQMQQNSCLMDSEYKDGLYDALNDVLDELKVGGK